MARRASLLRHVCCLALLPLAKSFTVYPGTVATPQLRRKCTLCQPTSDDTEAQAKLAGADPQALAEALALAKRREADWQAREGWLVDDSAERQRQLEEEEAQALARADRRKAELLAQEEEADMRGGDEGGAPPVDHEEWQRQLAAEEAEAAERARRREAELRALQEQEPTVDDDVWKRYAEEEGRARARAKEVQARLSTEADALQRALAQAEEEAVARNAQREAELTAFRSQPSPRAPRATPWVIPPLISSLALILLSRPVVASSLNKLVAAAFPALPPIAISADLAAKLSATAVWARSVCLLPLALLKLGAAWGAAIALRSFASFRPV